MAVAPSISMQSTALLESSACSCARTTAASPAAFPAASLVLKRTPSSRLRPSHLSLAKPAAADGKRRPSCPRVMAAAEPFSLASSTFDSARVEMERQQMAQIQRRIADSDDHPLSVAECMSQGQLVVARTSTTVFEALEALVENRITGMPVVDEENRVVGVVSDYDLLALDSIWGPAPASAAGAGSYGSNDIFPAPSSSWKAFREIQKLLGKSHGKTVGEVMTVNPLTVRPLTNLEDAARILLDSRFRRLPVVGEDGKLLGILTRGNVIRAALMMRRAAEGKGLAPAGGN